MPTPSRVFAPLASALIVSLSGVAHAQLLSPSVTVPIVTHSVARSGYRTNKQINFADCTADDIISFEVTLANRASYQLQVWGGNNSCTTAANRTTTTLTGCWLLYSATPSTNSFTVPLHVRDILWGQTLGGGVTTGTTTTSTAGTGGTTDTTSGGSGGTSAGGDTSTTTTTPTTTVPTGTLIVGEGEDACVDNSGVQAATTLAVTFMLIDVSAASAVVGTAATFALTYKLNAPNPPDSVSAGVGDTLLPIQFSYVNNQSTDTTINGYQFFCDPPPGPNGAADAGAVPVPTDAGPVTGDCQSTGLIPGEVAPSKYLCGTASLSATAGNATGLVDGVSYNVGVAATDTYENVGKVSTLSCQIPQPVTGFFKAYRAAGGQGGGGYCSFSRRREPLPLLALLGLASCLVVRRRRAA